MRSTNPTCLVVDPDEALRADGGRVAHGDGQWNLPLQTAHRESDVSDGRGTGSALIAPVVRERWSVTNCGHLSAGNEASDTSHASEKRAEAVGTHRLSENS